MPTPTEIEEFLHTYGDSIFPFHMSEYLCVNNKVLWGLLINFAQRRLDLLFGGVSNADLAQFNQAPIADSIAGYKVGARAIFPNLSADADVFLIANQCLDFSADEVKPLVIHELCHWYIDSGLQITHPLAIEAADRTAGLALHQRTDRNFEARTRHTLPFCEFLCAVARVAVNAGLGFGDEQELVQSAMRFDVRGGLRGLGAGQANP